MQLVYGSLCAWLTNHKNHLFLPSSLTDLVCEVHEAIEGPPSACCHFPRKHFVGPFSFLEDTDPINPILTKCVGQVEESQPEISDEFGVTCL